MDGQETALLGERGVEVADVDFGQGEFSRTLGIYLQVSLEAPEVVVLVDLGEFLGDQLFVDGLGVEDGALEQLGVLQLLLPHQHVVDGQQHFLWLTVFLRQGLS